MERNSEERARELRVEIERTREDLSETVDAIQEKLRPSNVVAGAASATAEKAKDMANSAAETAQEWWEASGGSGVVDRVRSNPIPAVIAGIGLAWLFWSDGRGRRSTPRDGGARRATANQRGGAAPRRSSLDNGMASARRVMRQGQHRVESMVRDYPLAVGAAAVIIGASLGMAVPETERENELMGEARDSALQRAQDAASGAVDRVKEAAANVVTGATLGD